MKTIKIHGIDEDDLSFIEDHFDAVAIKHPVEKLALIDIDDDNVFMKKGGEIFEAVHEGKGKRGNDLLTVGKPIGKIPDDKIKKLRERIAADLETIDGGDEDDENDDGGTGYQNPFLPTIDEIREGDE